LDFFNWLNENRCGVLHDQLLGPLVFPGCLTGAVYLQFLQEKLPQLLEDLPLVVRYRTVFQHDGTPPHFNRAVVAHLNVHSPERCVGRGSMYPWPPRSPDLSLLDYCIWGWMKDIVYQRKAQAREELLARIMHAAMEIRDNNVNLRRATCAVHKRADKCIEAEGGIFENVL
jgi:hypothetical protein